jgi:hypothetical protein
MPEFMMTLKMSLFHVLSSFQIKLCDWYTSSRKFKFFVNVDDFGKIFQEKIINHNSTTKYALKRWEYMVCISRFISTRTPWQFRKNCPVKSCLLTFWKVKIFKNLFNAFIYIFSSPDYRAIYFNISSSPDNRAMIYFNFF